MRVEIQEIVFLYRENLLGFKECRDLLEHHVTGLVQARDHELDEYMAMLEQSENESKSEEEELPDLP